MTPDFRDFVHIEQLKDQEVAPPAKGVTTLGQEKQEKGSVTNDYYSHLARHLSCSLSIN